MKGLIAMTALIACVAGAQADGFDCLIEPSQVVEIRASVDGIISAVNVLRGDVLKKGQILIQLQSEAERVAVESARYRAQMEAQIAAARTRVEYATSKFERIIDLQEKQFVTAQERDDTQAEMHLAQNELQAALENQELAKIEFRRAQEQLALRTVMSPFDGVVIDRLLNPGDLAESGNGRKAMLKIAQVDPLKVDVVMPAALFGQVTIGQAADVVSVVGGGRYVARVKLVDRVIDAASGTFVARLELPNPKLDVPIGSRCTAEFERLSSVAKP